MTPLRLILSAGVCSIALSGCIPVAASLALQAVSMVSGGGGKEGKGFRNPMDKQTSERQVREALSRLNDRVDPACQAQLDAMEKKTDKPDAAAAGAAPAKDASAPVTSAKPEAAVPVNLLAKVGPEQGQADAARTADTAPGAGSERAPGEAAPAQPAPAEAAKGDDETKPVKAALAPSGSAAPGQCEHRLVCLPGTPKPTLMLMCPGKGDPKAAAKTVAAGDAPAAPADAQASNAPATDAPAADAKAVDAQTPAVIPAVAKTMPSDPAPVVTPVAAVSVTPPAVPVVVPPPLAGTAPAAEAPVATPAAPAPAKVTTGAVPKLTVPPIAAPAAVPLPPAVSGAPLPAPAAAAGVPKITAPAVTPPSPAPMPAVAGAAPTVAIPDIMPTIAPPLAPPPALDASTGAAETAARPADTAGAPKAVPRAAPAPNASAPSGTGRSIEKGGVADWNWSYDPAKQL